MEFIQAFGGGSRQESRMVWLLLGWFQALLGNSCEWIRV